MQRYDLCLAWNWPYDADFVALLDAALQSRGLSLLPITPEDLEVKLHDLRNGRCSFRVLLDRASDSDQRFLAVVEWAREHRVQRLNPYELTSRAWDKSAMHRALGSALHTPATIILPPFAEQPDLPSLDFGPLGAHFNIKPAHGGGGEGVIIGATSVEQVSAARAERPTDRYLLQSHVDPVFVGGRPAWFRALYCTGQVFPCWWDPQTHIYVPVTWAEEQAYELQPLHSLTEAIARACGLDLFSSELALAADGRFLAIDYVNDPIDLRLQSRVPEGVPDEIVQAIVERLADAAVATP